MSIAEHQRAVLARDVPEKGLVVGDVGTVVSIHGGDDRTSGYTLEFFSLSGETLAIVAVPADAVRPVGPREVTHARAIRARVSLNKAREYSDSPDAWDGIGPCSCRWRAW